MTRAAVLLAGAALVRLIVAPAPAQGPLDGRASITDSLLAAGDSALEEKASRGRPFEPDETIDPNVAGEIELDRLPGIGPARALQIVREREESGPFASVEDLVRVPGIGAASIERIRPFLRIASPVATAVATRTPSFTVGGEGRKSPVVGRPFDLNLATESQLRELPGIGPVTADRIVAYRDEHGGFQKTEELMEVAGIGARTFARIAPLVTVRR